MRVSIFRTKEMNFICSHATANSLLPRTLENMEVSSRDSGLFSKVIKRSMTVDCEFIYSARDKFWESETST